MDFGIYFPQTHKTTLYTLNVCDMRHFIILWFIPTLTYQKNLPIEKIMFKIIIIQNCHTL